MPKFKIKFHLTVSETTHCIRRISLDFHVGMLEHIDMCLMKDHESRSPSSISSCVAVESLLHFCAMTHQAIKVQNKLSSLWSQYVQLPFAQILKNRFCNIASDGLQQLSLLSLSLFTIHDRAV